MSSLIGRVRRFADILAAQTQWTSGPGEGQLPATAHTIFVICDKSIEESFRDEKSGSFNLEATKLTDPERLNHLLLAIAVAVLWIYDIGEDVLRAGERQEIDPAYKRQLSVFQIGWRKLRRWSTCQSSTLPVLTLRLSPFRLAPAWRKC